jgi:hypothetical protein
VERETRKIQMNKKEMRITVHKKDEKAEFENDYIADPKESLDILETLEIGSGEFFI